MKLLLHLPISLLLSGWVHASDSDPAHTPPPPASAIGFSDRSPALDALPGFQSPPPGYGIAPFYWWLGDPITKERLAWQLEQMKGMGVSGYQINYAHSAKGGRSWGLTIPCAGEIQVWADGRKLAAKMTNGEWNATLPAPARSPVVVAIRVEQVRGEYGGAAFRDFIRLDCGAGEIAPGDWSQAGVLETYSGAAWYRKSFPLTAPVTTGKVILDLGNVVASAVLRVNGKPAGTKSAPPWTFDITDFVKSGENQIEVLVSNTLANHYVTIPTHYRGKTTSGLIGPVSIKLFR